MTAHARRPESQDVPPHPDGDRLAHEAEPRAIRLVGAVHHEGAWDVARITDGLDRDELIALAVMLAAMVDDERTANELLAWTQPNRTPLRRVENIAAGDTYRGWLTTDLRTAHAQRGRGLTDPWTIEGERLYQMRRNDRRRAQRREQTTS